MPTQLDLRRAGLLIAENAIIAGEVSFEPPVKIIAGVSIRSSSIGAYSYVSAQTQLKYARIGRYCSIGDNVLIGPPAHPTHWLGSSQFFYDDVFEQGLTAPPLDFDVIAPVDIGHDVWIGSRVSIMSGVSIGHGAIVGLGAVVTKDIEPYTIVGGVPAKPIRRRFDDALIDQLLGFEWWRFDLGAARKAGLAVDWSKPQRALEVLRQAEAADQLPLIDPARTITLKSGPARPA
jgi:acetyltransferase-like isoleucine patch superfamily enzyme